MLTDGAHAGGIKISMCGEFAGDENAVALLFGMGLDAFSMSGISIPRVKRVMSKLNKKDCEALVEKILDFTTAEEIKKEVKSSSALNLIFKNPETRPIKPEAKKTIKPVRISCITGSVQVFCKSIPVKSPAKYI